MDSLPVWNPDRIEFKRVRTDDLPMLHRWQNSDHVRKWWSSDREVSMEEIEKEHLPRIREEAPTQPYLIVYDGKPIGYIQGYLISDYPDYARYLQIDEDAAGVDLYVGEAAYCYRGLGTLALLKFLKENVFSRAETVSCVLGPNPENAAAIRAYEKVGFRYVKTIQVPDEPNPEYVMRVTREDLRG
jgi:RimJ/RimL family protein N-acetyltransferase